MHFKHRQGMAEYCEMTRSEFMPMCDWYVLRQADGGYLGFKGHPDGDAKILAVAHIDYNLSGVVHACNRKRIISSALDDRAGVYAAFNLLPEYGIKADILLTDFEERGNSTIKMLGAGMLDKYNWIVELDRAGEGAVAYNYVEIVPKLEQFWEVGKGGGSDIREIQEISPVSAFNMGICYEQMHTEKCELSWKVLHRQLLRLKEFYDQYVDTKFERDHVLGEVYDHPFVRYVPQPAPRARSAGYDRHWQQDYHHADKGWVQQAPDVGFDPICDFCGGPIGPKGTTIRGMYDICEWCAGDSDLTDVTSGYSEDSYVAPVDPMTTSQCEVCRELTTTLIHIREMGWWVCRECHDSVENKL